ncbi:uncharacterized protein LOC142590943 [Dermacentor variabilis]|uniref:uncharacterized protein LOC142590943 n=1 Tax=Dermacentor variabilis TaxID=34621 RepID=UPI003F5B9A18
MAFILPFNSVPALPAKGIVNYSSKLLSGNFSCVCTSTPTLCSYPRAKLKRIMAVALFLNSLNWTRRPAQFRARLPWTQTPQGVDAGRLPSSARGPSGRGPRRAPPTHTPRTPPPCNTRPHGRK